MIINPSVRYTRQKLLERFHRSRLRRPKQKRSVSRTQLHLPSWVLPLFKHRDISLNIEQSLHRLKTADLLSLITLHAGLTNGNPAALVLNLSAIEAYSVISAVESLLGTDPERKAEVIRGFLSGEGEHQGVSCAHIASLHLPYIEPFQMPVLSKSRKRLPTLLRLKKPPNQPQM